MLDSWVFRVVFVPSAVFLSVVFGGSYGTGREVMEFVSQHGPRGGLVSMASVFLTYLALLAVTWGIARRFATYEYSGFMARILGPLWRGYELVIIVGLVLALAICTAAAGAIASSHFAMPSWVGSIVLLLLVFTLNYRGRQFVEKSMMLAVLALLVVLILLLKKTLALHGSAIAEAFASDEMESGAVLGGIQYALVNGGYIPLMLYCARGLRTGGDVIVASCAAAAVVLVPAVVFHFCFMSAFPAITAEELPAYWLVERDAGSLLLNVYVGVVFLLVIQTGVGLLQGFIERLDGWSQAHRGEPLSPIQHGMVGAGMVLLSMALSLIGIVQLIITGYDVLVIGFLLTFSAPLLTRGVWLLVARETARD